MLWGSKHIFLRGEDRISLSSYRFHLNNSPQIAAQQYIFSLQGNNIFLYTHAEENSGKVLTRMRDDGVGV